MEQHEKAVLALISRALFGATVELDAHIGLNAVFKEACNQSVFALIYCNLTEAEKERIPIAEQEKWKIQLYMHIAKMEQLLYEQKDVLAILSENHIPVAILKGSTCAANYPDPTIRAMGDIDILVSPDEQRRAVKLLQKNGYSEILDEKHHCHFTVRKGNISVEVHKEPNGLFMNENTEIKAKFDEFFADALDNIKMRGDYPMLSDKHQAVVLILHKLEHFTLGGLGLRQLCDWAVFVQNRMTPTLWSELEPLLASFGLLTFTRVITETCVDSLGLPKECAPWALDFDPDLCEKVIEAIMKNGNFGIKNSAYGERFFVDFNSKNQITSLFKVLGSSCRIHWPICEKYPVLMLIAPFVVCFRYLILRIQGKRPKFRFIKLYKRAGAKQQLYKDLMPFVVNNNTER